MLSREDFKKLAAGNFVNGKSSVNTVELNHYCAGAMFAYDYLTEGKVVAPSTGATVSELELAKIVREEEAAKQQHELGTLKPRQSIDQAIGEGLTQKAAIEQ